MLPNISGILQVASVAEKIKKVQSEKGGKLSAKIKTTDVDAPTDREFRAFGYKLAKEKGNNRIYEKAKPGEPTKKNSKVTLRPGQSEKDFEPKGEGWSSKQVGNKIIYKRSKKEETKTAAPNQLTRELTDEEMQMQNRGRKNPNEAQYRKSENPSLSEENQRYVIKMKKEKEGGGGYNSGGSGLNLKAGRQAAKRYKIKCSKEGCKK